MQTTSFIPDFKDLERAHKLIQPHIHRTPVFTCRQVNERAGGRVAFKCENFQKVGAFKIRGACNAILSMPEQDVKKGVATHSSGNHAQAVALAAGIREVPAYIVMPKDAPRVKVEAVKGYGADITFCEPTLEARETTLEDVIKKTGAVFIHPYNDGRIIAGQGTAALEFLEDSPDLDLVLAPVGGGGLISGTAIAAKNMDPDIEVIGVEPETVNDAYLSFTSGTLHPATGGETVADGLRTSLGELSFKCISTYVDDIITVKEKEIVEAMRFTWERMKIIIEPSSAVPIAALFNHTVDITDRKAGVILSGGNVDLDHLPWN